jgi:hypothetical protein
MSTHFSTVCEYGYTHSTCRCAVKDKTIRLIVCNNAEHAKAPKNKTSGSEVLDLKQAINDIAPSVGKVGLRTDRPVEEYLMLAHEIEVAAKSNYDTAQRSLWPDDNRNRGYRGC